MKKIIIGLLALGSVTAQANDCVVKNIWMTDVIYGTKSRSPEQVFVENHAHDIRNSKIIFLGEEHDDMISKKNYPSLITLISQVDSSFNCIALELDDSLQNKLDSAKNNSQIITSLNSGDTLSYDDEENQEILQPWLNAGRTLDPTLRKIFLIDDGRINPSNQHVPKEWLLNYQEVKQAKYSKWMNKRNKYMAFRILQLINSGECTKIISINGRAHLHLTNDLVRPIQEHTNLPSWNVFLLSGSRSSIEIEENKDIASFSTILRY